MARSLLLALTLTIPASVAHAQVVFTHKWDGAMRIVSQSAACTKQFVSTDNNRAFYHLRFDEYYPFSSLTRFGNGETELILSLNYNNYSNTTAAAPRHDNNGQFSGAGNYESIKIAHGFIGVSSYGTYTFTQSPAVVTDQTAFINLTGTLNDYNNTSGCKITLQGTFVRVGVEDEAPPPY